MPRRFVTDIRPGERVEDEVFLIQSKDLRTTTSGSLYIHAVLADKTGHLVARQWQATEPMFEQMPEGGFMRFKGRAENYKGNLQFIIDAMRVAEPGTYEVADFLPVSKENVEEMWTRLVGILKGVKHPELAAILQEFLADRQLMEKFQRAPAATAMHHAYIGGLLEHTLKVSEVALRVVPLYPRLSVDLVLAGIFLHDIGKAEELTFETSIGYSDDGQLVGHIARAAVWIEQKAEAASKRLGKPFPSAVKVLLQHIVLSHHGRYEFGSPRLPAIPEAAVIHYLDNLDAKVQMFLHEIETDADPVSRWTNYNRALESKVYKVDVFGTRGS